MTTTQLLQNAKLARATAAAMSTVEKDALLLAMAQSLCAHTDAIVAANALDLAAAQGTVSPVMLDRLTLTPARIEDMAQGLRAVAALPDPVGEVLEDFTRPNGLHMTKQRVPMGVIAMIYESRPNVTADAAALCLKSGNVCVLRGGKEAIHSNIAIVDALQQALAAQGAPITLINLVTDTSRESAHTLMQARGLIDLLIPRGGAGLIRTCVDNAKVPCIETGTGICHIYIDKAADPDMALRILQNAKASRPSVCNAAEVCLVHAAIAPQFLPQLSQTMQACGVHLRLCPIAATYIEGTAADADDFDTEFLDYILAVKVVPDTQAAIAHIAQHSTGHSEAIVSSDADAASLFTKAVDSAAVYVNASTRFTDGGEFGLGCEIGISTQKLGARGPMGLREMTSVKYIIQGNGQIR